jgi:hypothetical protein
MGREPTPEDLIVPAREIGQRTLDGRPDYAGLLAGSPHMTQAELNRVAQVVDHRKRAT